MKIKHRFRLDQKGFIQEYKDRSVLLNERGEVFTGIQDRDLYTDKRSILAKVKNPTIKIRDLENKVGISLQLKDHIVNPSKFVADFENLISSALEGVVTTTCLIVEKEDVWNLNIEDIGEYDEWVLRFSVLTNS